MMIKDMNLEADALSESHGNLFEEDFFDSHDYSHVFPIMYVNCYTI